MKKVTVPNKKYALQIEIVKAAIPLLISKKTMKELGMQLDFTRDLVIIDNERIKLMCTSSGNYCIALNTTPVDSENITLKVL